MTIEYNGTDITGTLSELSVDVSFDKLFSTLSFSGNTLLSECKFRVSDGIDYDMVLWSASRDRAAFNMVFVSKIQYKWLMSSVGPVTGKFDFAGLCKKVGIPFMTQSATEQRYYELPNMQFLDFLNWLSDRVACKRAWFMTFTFDGLFGVDSNSFYTVKPPERANTNFYRINSFRSSSDLFLQVRAEGVLNQDFIDSDSVVVNFETAVKGVKFNDSVYELVTVTDLGWVSPNISKQQYFMNLDTATRMSITSDRVSFGLGSLFTDDKGAVYFVNSVSSNSSGQNVVLCYIKNI
jgi:hypothetical protein